MEKVEDGKERSMMEKDVQTRSKRACAICGNPLPPGRPRYCSEACEKTYAQQREKSRTGKKPRLPPFRMLTCPICGTVEQRHIKSKLCAACQAEKDKKTYAEFVSRSRAGKSRKIGEKYPCEACGKLYVLCSGKQRYCKDCAENEVGAHVRQAAIDRYNEAKDVDPEFLRKRQERRAKADEETRMCVVCGKSFVSSPNLRLYCSKECQEKGTRAQSRESDKERTRKEPRDRGNPSPIARARLSVGLTQAQLAKAVGVKPQQIGNWERGLRNPKLDALKKMADALGCDLSDLMKSS